jgi:pyruvyl transferase EpsO
MADGDLVGGYKAMLHGAFADVLAPATPVALLGAPDTAHCGDHALWLGEEAVIAACGAKLVYRASAKSYDRALMERALGGGTILFHGGNGGSAAFDFLARVLNDFPGNAVIVCPHEFGPGADAALARVADVATSRKGIVLFARSGLARDRAARIFGPSFPLRLAPDMAFALGPQARPVEPAYDILWLARTDRAANDDRAEAATRLSSQAAEKFAMPDFDDGLEIGFAVKHRPPTVLLTDWSSLFPENVLTRMALRALDPHARAKAYVARGLHMLSLGHIAITDRLHGHIFAILLGIPHILLDDGSGKNLAFHETWTRDSTLCRVAADASDAWSLARASIPAIKENPGAGWP